MDIPTGDIIKILVSFAAGGILGFERESHSKPAGLRTMVLITVGSTLFSILSISLNNSSFDRIASNIVTGVGFVGGGVIFKEGGSLKGITTAATIWAAAAIGMAVGFAAFWLAGITTAIVILTLTILSWIEDTLDTTRQRQRYTVTFAAAAYSVEQLYNFMKAHDIKVTQEKLMKDGLNLTVVYFVKAHRKKLRQLEQDMIANEQITHFEV